MTNPRSGTEPPLSGAELLSRAHLTDEFDCGEPELTDWLRQFALTNQQNESARVLVVHRGMRVVGYYALAASSVAREDTPPRVSRGLAGHPVPVILLARLAVDLSEQGRGLGSALLKDALHRVSQTAELIGARALLVDALNEDARAFYEQFNFEPSTVDPLHLFLLMKDVRARLERP